MSYPVFPPPYKPDYPEANQLPGLDGIYSGGIFRKIDEKKYEAYKYSPLYDPACVAPDWVYVDGPGIPHGHTWEPPLDSGGISKGDLYTHGNCDVKAYAKIKSDGGPVSYYDFPASWTTFNDFIEHKSETQWLGFSFHLGNIGKALCRWGDKDGTSIEYDAKKIIYSGVRILKMIVGTKKTREYLVRLLDDPQFQEK